VSGVFSERELAYLRAQRLARLATVSRGLQPDVAPVTYAFDGARFYVGGLSLTRTLKYRNVRDYSRVALVVDDAPADGWTPRGVKVHGTAMIGERVGPAGPAPAIVITPTTHWSWGIEAPPFRDGAPVIRRIVWGPPAGPGRPG